MQDPDRPVGQCPQRDVVVQAAVAVARSRRGHRVRRSGRFAPAGQRVGEPVVADEPGQHDLLLAGLAGKRAGAGTPAPRRARTAPARVVTELAQRVPLGLHLDNSNQGNPASNGWIVRVWLELTDDPASVLVLRPAEFDRKAETRIPLPRSQQVVLDSEALYHGGYHAGPQTRYAVIASVESGPDLERWIESQRL